MFMALKLRIMTESDKKLKIRELLCKTRPHFVINLMSFLNDYLCSSFPMVVGTLLVRILLLTIVYGTWTLSVEHD